MAIKEISIVPTNSGTAPKAPEEPTWSARMAVCGLQLVPNRNSVTGTASKKRRDSNSTESKMPRVVKIATQAQLNSTPLNTRSTCWRARNRGEMVSQAPKPPSSAKPSTPALTMRLPISRRAIRRSLATTSAESTLSAASEPVARFRTVLSIRFSSETLVGCRASGSDPNTNPAINGSSKINQITSSNRDGTAHHREALSP